MSKKSIKLYNGGWFGPFMFYILIFNLSCGLAETFKLENTLYLAIITTIVIIFLINFIIDSIVLLISLKKLKLDRHIYSKTILKFVMCGFVADIVGDLVNILVFVIIYIFELSYKINIFLHNRLSACIMVIASFIVITLVSTCLSSVLIYNLDLKIALKKIDLDQDTKKKIAKIFTIFTTPYLRLIIDLFVAIVLPLAFYR
jgi:hypothetical protein